MSVTISGQFIHHVRLIYEMALEGSLSGKNLRYGINVFSFNALPAYVVAVASVEAFLNEAFLSDLTSIWLPEMNDTIVSKEWLEKIELQVKLILIPHIFVGKTLTRDSQPYQDMSLLIKIRNDLIHYKASSMPPKYMGELSQRRIVMSGSSPKKESNQIWVYDLSCSEGVRWAHNTACRVVHAIADFCIKREPPLVDQLASNFQEIHESYADRWYSEHGIDPKSNDPEITL